MVQQELNNSNAEIREVAQEAFEDIKMEVPYSLNQSEKIPVFGAQNSHSLQIDNMNKQPV
jgi:thymidylate synthase ThyX